VVARTGAHRGAGRANGDRVAEAKVLTCCATRRRIAAPRRTSGAGADRRRQGRIAQTIPAPSMPALTIRLTDTAVGSTSLGDDRDPTTIGTAPKVASGREYWRTARSFRPSQKQPYSLKGTRARRPARRERPSVIRADGGPAAQQRVPLTVAPPVKWDRSGPAARMSRERVKLQASLARRRAVAECGWAARDSDRQRRKARPYEIEWGQQRRAAGSMCTARPETSADRGKGPRRCE